ncbi:MAG: CHAT domain-containing protein [Caldilineaceae bacterium]|nr:CHAT domain-containing protein [Caldilineaceae bacterium]
MFDPDSGGFPEDGQSRAAAVFQDWDDRRLLNAVDTVLRRLYRAWSELDAPTRGRLDRLRTATADAAGDSGISAWERRAVLVRFLEDLAVVDAAFEVVREAVAEGGAGAAAGNATPRGINYLESVNLLRVMRDEPAHYIPRTAGRPPRSGPPRSGPAQPAAQPRTGGRAEKAAEAPQRRTSPPPPTGEIRGGPQVQLYTYVDFPLTISNRSDVKYPLVVQLVRDRPRESRGEGEVNISFADEIEYVDVVVRAPAFEEVSGYGAGARDGPAFRRTIAVPRDADSQPAVFLLQLADDRTGPQWVSVDFYHRGRNAGSLTLEVEVAGFQFWRGRTRRAELASDDEDGGPVAFGPASVVRAVDGVTIPQGASLPAADVELRVVRDADGRTLHFHLHSQKAPALDGRGAGSVVFSELSSPGPFFERLVDRLSSFAARAGADLPGDEAMRMEDEVADIGVELYELLFPEALRHLYWELKALREAGVVRNLLIVSDEPWIPWELVKPFDTVEGRDVEDDHLAAAWQMSRWLSGAAVPSDLDIRAARLVVPMFDLDFVWKEIEYFDSLAARQIEVLPPISTRAEFLEAAEKGGEQLYHFATHANFNQAFVDESPIVLQGDPLFPSDLTRRRARGMRRERPLVFLNTCHGARVGFNLTGLGGWAQRLVDQLGVTAFVGALWEVNDELASRFAHAFYEELWAGKTLGEAFHSARQRVRALQSGNPTWLAYTLYGDPNSRIVWTAGAGGRAAAVRG